MKKEKNNLFKYATKELSQDAFICWCINWFNYRKIKDNTENENKLCEMAEKILTKIFEDANKKVPLIKSINITRQYQNIDITLIVKTIEKEEYAIIIEDKKTSILSDKQKENLYVNKFIDSINDSKYGIENKERVGLQGNILEENVIPVYWKTSKWEEDREKMQTELENNLNKKVVCIDGIDTLNFIKDYVNFSEIIRDFYNCLKEELDINNVTNQVEEIIENKQIKIGTKFTTNYYCYNCFKELLEKEYDAKSHPMKGGIDLIRLNEKIGKKDFVHVDTVNLFNVDGSWKNEFFNGGTVWIESPSKSEDLKTKIKYAFVFGKKRDAFRRLQYVFMGFYRLMEINENNNSRMWMKVNNLINDEESEECEIIDISMEKVLKTIKKCEEIYNKD